MNATNNFIQMRRGGKGRGATTKLGKTMGKLMPQLPNWGSMFFGVLIGIFVTSLVVFTFSTSDITLRIPTSSAKKVQTIAKNPNRKDEVTPTVAMVDNEAMVVQEPRFDFYTELTKTSQENTTAAPAKSFSTSTQGAKSTTLDLKSRPKTINGYLVQAGHFRKAADADALRAKLALNGYNAKDVASKEQDGEVWHRIMLGPVKTERNAKELQKQLKGLEVESILVLKYNN